MSGLMHKVKDAVTGHHHDSTHTSNTTGTHGTHHTTADTTTTNHGPHHSKLANKLDPRVDGDRGMLYSHLKLSCHC
jgi:fatty-acid desaturase